MRRRILLANKQPYLDVQPSEVQWITVEEAVRYNVRSNTNWNIT